MRKLMDLFKKPKDETIVVPLLIRMPPAVHSGLKHACENAELSMNEVMSLAAENITEELNDLMASKARKA